jgi:hypothetical protein
LEQSVKQPIFKTLGESLLVLLITVLLCLAAFLFLPVIIFVPVPLIVIMVRRGFFYGFLPIVLLAVLLYFLWGKIAASLFIALIVPAVFIIAYALQRKVRSFEAVVFSVGAYAFGLALVIAFFYFVLRTDAITYTVNAFNQLMQNYKGSAQEMLLLLNISDVAAGTKDISVILALPEVEAIRQATEELRVMIQSLFPSIISFYSVAGGLVCYVVSRGMLKKKGVSVAPIPVFSKFRLSKGFFMGMLVLAGLFLLGSLMDIPNFNAVFEVCYTAYIIVFVICGLSLTDFLLARKNVGKGARIAILVASGLLFSFVLVWMGLLDVLFKVKDRIEKPDEFDGE